MDPLAPLISALHAEGRLRVWSLVITVFGDLVQHRGGQITTQRLGQLLGRVGVESGTVRTALSRLTRDGWLERERQGRSSLCRLSAQGIDRFAPATSRIYAAPRAAPVSEWSMLLRLEAGREISVAVSPADQAVSSADCVVQGRLSHISEAYRASLLTDEHRQALEALSADLNALSGLTLAGLDAAAARMLLIHRWRRIVLRFPELVPELLPADAPLVHARQSVAGCYRRLLGSGESWLDTPLDGEAPMPKADATLAQRFVSSTET